MKLAKYVFIIATIFIVVPLISGCVNVPKGTVELSQAIREDLDDLYDSYAITVRSYFQSLREQVENEIETQWFPLYMEELTRSPKIKALLQEDMREEQILQGAQLLAISGARQLTKKQRVATYPLNRLEQEVLRSVRIRIDEIRRANETLTTGLITNKDIEHSIKGLDRLNDLQKEVNSKLQEAQDEVQKFRSELRTIK